MQGRVSKEKEGYYVFDSFKAYGCIAAFSYGSINLGFKNNPGLEVNRKNFLKKLNINYRDLICLKQVHGNKILLASQKDKGRGALDYACAVPGFDGIITADKGLPLAVLTADCLSVFLYDTKRIVSGLVHAGWRSTRKNIVLGALRTMKDVFSSRMQDVICGFGPSIRPCCYEVGAEFKNYFNSGLLKRQGKLFLDLASLNYEQLVSAGVPPRNITDSGICTFCGNNIFFSYRRDGPDTGRMMSVIMISENHNENS